MVDCNAEELELSISGRNFTIKQSPGVLQSTREAGTTGATLWRACVRFAEWLGSGSNPLFERGVLDSESIILELGSGISGLVPSILGPNVGKVVATDQQYIIRRLQENIASNTAQIKKKMPNRKTNKVSFYASNIEVLPLDWETDDITGFLRSNALEAGVDAVVACDCIFNYALIGPLVQTCIDICKARRSSEKYAEVRDRLSLCIIAQQLRQPEVFEQWLEAFMAAFHVWRIQNSMFMEASKEGSGLVVHVGILRQAGP